MDSCSALAQPLACVRRTRQPVPIKMIRKIHALNTCWLSPHKWSHTHRRKRLDGCLRKSVQPAVRCGVPPWLGSLPDAIRGGSFARAVIRIPRSVNSFIGNPLKVRFDIQKRPVRNVRLKDIIKVYIQEHTSFLCLVCESVWLRLGHWMLKSSNFTAKQC